MRTHHQLVDPAQAGTQLLARVKKAVDIGLRRYDKDVIFPESESRSLHFHSYKV